MTLKYATDIYSYMRSIEFHPQIGGCKMPNTKLSHGQWLKIYDWLIHITLEMCSNGDALYLAIEMTARYLASVKVPQEKMQLVAAAAFWIASKYEDVTSVTALDLAYSTAGTITEHKLNKMEYYILTELNFNVSFPTTHYFLNHFIATIRENSHMLNGKISKVIPESKRNLVISMGHSDIPKYPPSLRAATSLYLACRKYEIKWCEKLVRITGYEEGQMTDYSRIILDLSDIIKTHISSSKLPNLKKILSGP